MTTGKTNIVIGSAPSSGSTLLVNIIGRSPEVFQCGELSIFDKRDWITDDRRLSWSRFEKLSRRGYKRRLACEMSHHFGNVDCFSIPRLCPARTDSYLGHCDHLMSELASVNGKERWVEKTPANIFSLGEIERRRPEWRYVVIVRDPRSVLLSLSKRGYGKAMAAARWYLPNLIALNLSASQRVSLVCYEDLVGHSKNTINRLCQDLGADFTQDLLSAEKHDALHLNSWQASPNETPNKAGLWADEKSVPEGYMEALREIRPSQYFVDTHELANTPDAMGLASALGYRFSWNIGRSQYSSVQCSLYADYARYIAAMTRRLYIPRAIPFYFRKA